MLKAVLRKSRPYTPSRLRIHVYCPEVARVWVRLVWDGWKDLAPAIAEHIEDVGERPEWLSDAEQFEEAMGCETGDHWTRFALGEGLAPNQLFLVEFKPPRVTQSGYETIEYDVEYDWEIIEAAPWAKSKVLRSWSSWLNKREKLNAVCEAKRAQERREAGERTDLMCVEVHSNDNRHIGTKGTTYTAQLCTKIRRGTTLAWGKEQPSVLESVEELAAVACRKYNHLSPELVLAMPRDHRFYE